MKKTYSWIISILILLALIFFIRFFIGGSEDSWIKDSRGVWVKHGNPAQTPDYVLEQQKLVNDALEIYNQKKLEGIVFNSQCLGVVVSEMSTDAPTNEMIKYAVDIVHVPRSDVDNLIENQCGAYHFIELDKEGNIVRII